MMSDRHTAAAHNPLATCRWRGCDGTCGKLHTVTRVRPAPFVVRNAKPYVAPTWTRAGMDPKNTAHTETLFNDNEDSLVLTEKLLEACFTARRGITSATIKALCGRASGLQRGWRQALIGTRISRTRYESALAGRTIMSKATLRMQSRKEKRGK